MPFALMMLRLGMPNIANSLSAEALLEKRSGFPFVKIRLNALPSKP